MASDDPKHLATRPTPKPTITLKKAESEKAKEIDGGTVPPVPAGIGSVAVPVKKEDGVHQPTGGTIPEQKATEASAKSAPTSTRQFDLPPTVYSPQLLESVIYDIERYLDWYRQSSIQKRVGARTVEEPTHSAETVLVIEAWLNGKAATLESLEALLAHLRSLKLAQVHIMLAALPNRAQREALVTWFRTNVGPHLLLSFVADRNLGGGVVIRTPNRVFDYTWKQQLIAGRDKLAEILKRV